MTSGVYARLPTPDNPIEIVFYADGEVQHTKLITDRNATRLIADLAQMVANRRLPDAGT